ncbi:NADP-dependent oxidoreductase domain-containing protein [Armillaria mellea]|nr:NADP-dependent oxidoreductase domain-containing protein [Armillaria mellea]
MSSPAMSYAILLILGASGLKVSNIILGCAVYESPDWLNWVQDEEESISQIKAAYSSGQSEVLGKAIEGDSFFYGTKWAAAYADSIRYVNQYGLSRKVFETLFSAPSCRAVAPGNHRSDIKTRVQTIGRILRRKKNQNAKVMHPPDYSLDNRFIPFILIMQNDYNLLYREDENEMLPTLKYFGVATVSWSPLAHGAVVMPLARVA